jgi:hypothetical protein
MGILNSEPSCYSTLPAALFYFCKVFRTRQREAEERTKLYCVLLNGAERILRVDVCFGGKEFAIFMGSEGLLPWSKESAI